jgi:hypothetical protein
MLPHEDSAPSRPTRLTGWKEISAHCGKGVRTVQRWERELGLPVRRDTTLRGDHVYALVEEVDAWMLRAERTETPEERAAAPVDTPPAGASTAAWHTRLFAVGPRWLFPLLAVVTSVGIVAAGGLRLAWLARNSGEPARLLVDVDRIRVLDAGGAELWRYGFGFALQKESYSSRRPTEPTPFLIIDIDGDGTREVLFRASPARAADAPLFCFNADGSLRFSWNQRSPVVFGTTVYQPPFGIRSFLPGRRNGKPVLWTVAAHSPYFPSLLTALNSKTGRPETAYWNCGTLNALAFARLRGRDVILAGGVDNELKQPVLLAVDIEAANGSTPVTLPYYRCDACPQAPPLAMVVFPIPDLPEQTANGGLSSVRQINVDEMGNLIVHIIYPTHAFKGELYGETGALYTLDRELRVLHAEFTADYEARHRYAEGLGLVRHPFKDSEASQLYPVQVSFAGAPWERRLGPFGGE